MVCGMIAGELDVLLENALREDAPYGDKTTEALSLDGEFRAELVAREKLVLCGLPAAFRVFELAGDECRFEALRGEGDEVKANGCIGTVEGPLRTMLYAERTALNLLQRLCGIATMARRCYLEVRGTGARVLDTRKTTPGLRALEKYAVRTGGATNHRMGLSDAILIKDNHIAAVGSIAEAVKRVKEKTGAAWRVEVEVKSLDQIPAAITAGANIILLDNMTPAELKKALKSRREGILFEASGGVTLKNLRAVAESGVDYVSMGALTHSARAVDIALDIRAS